MALPYPNITPIPVNPAPEALSVLWNTRYDEIDENFAHIEAQAEIVASNNVMKWM